MLNWIKINVLKCPKFKIGDKIVHIGDKYLESWELAAHIKKNPKYTILEVGKRKYKVNEEYGTVSPYIDYVDSNFMKVE